jgi:hypothetical protein
MTEYALILAAVAVVVFVTYEVMGQDIKTLVTLSTATLPPRADFRSRTEDSTSGSASSKARKLDAVWLRFVYQPSLKRMV